MALLEVEHLRKVYTARLGGVGVEALKDVSFSVEAGEFVAIMGESGSGKTTLLNILAALDTPTAGDVLLNGQPMGRLKERDLTAFRRENLGFVFQDFNLLDAFTVRDNIFLPLVLSGMAYEQAPAPGKGPGHREAGEQIPLRAVRRPKAAHRRGPGHHHPAGHFAGG